MLPNSVNDMAVGPLDLTNSTRTAFTYTMDKKESSRQYLVRRAKDELEEACATEHNDEISGEQFARNILNCLVRSFSPLKRVLNNTNYVLGLI